MTFSINTLMKITFRMGQLQKDILPNDIPQNNSQQKDTQRNEIASFC